MKIFTGGLLIAARFGTRESTASRCFSAVVPAASVAAAAAAVARVADVFDSEISLTAAPYGFRAYMATEFTKPVRCYVPVQQGSTLHLGSARYGGGAEDDFSGLCTAHMLCAQSRVNVI